MCKTPLEGLYGIQLLPSEGWLPEALAACDTMALVFEGRTSFVVEVDLQGDRKWGFQSVSSIQGSG